MTAFQREKAKGKIVSFLTLILILYVVVGILGCSVFFRPLIENFKMMEIFMIVVYYIMVCLGFAAWRDCRGQLENPDIEVPTIRKKLWAISCINWVFSSLLWAIALSLLMFVGQDSIKPLESYLWFSGVAALSVPFLILNIYHHKIIEISGKLASRSRAKTVRSRQSLNEALKVSFADVYEGRDYEDM